VIDAVELTTTLPDEQSAEELVQVLVGSGLCACVKLAAGVRSSYFWEGSWKQAEEHEVRALSLPEHVLALTKLIVASHPYEVPEVMVRSVSLPHHPYAEWVTQTIARTTALTRRRGEGPPESSSATARGHRP